MGPDMSRLNADQKDLSRENEHLRMELQALKTPGRLEPLARGQLGLVPPTPEQFVTVDSRVHAAAPTTSPPASALAPVPATSTPAGAPGGAPATPVARLPVAGR